jgi:SAM-dependent methyltransferase
MPARVLEVGGNANPMLANRGLRLVNLDVDVVGLQVGEMLRRRDRHHCVMLCGDAEDLPFAPGHFDAIVMFASLHHFPDPGRVLGHLASRLSPDGFIAVLCEPVGHIHPGAVDRAFKEELEKGVNEQSFTRTEYDMIFQRARLRAEEAVIDFNSLKARLVPWR